jgi:hypothetical protein
VVADLYLKNNTTQIGLDADRKLSSNPICLFKRKDVRVRLLTASEVPKGARVLFGVLAGANELAVQVDVFETANRNLVVSFTAKGEF